MLYLKRYSYITVPLECWRKIELVMCRVGGVSDDASSLPGDSGGIV